MIRITETQLDAAITKMRRYAELSDMNGNADHAEECSLIMAALYELRIRRAADSNETEPAE